MTSPDLLARLSACPSTASLVAILPDRAIEALEPDGVTCIDGVTCPAPDPAPCRARLRWHRIQPDGQREAILAFAPTGRPGVGTGAFDVTIRVDRPDGWSPVLTVPWQASVGPGRVVPGRADTRATVEGLFSAYFADGTGQAG
jgi:hypothetical protein